MCFRLARILVCLLAAGLGTTTGSAQSMEFHKIIDTKTALPGGPTEWNSFGYPSIHNGEVAFQGFERYGASRSIMLSAAANGGPLTQVIDSTALMPHSGKPMTYMWNPTLRNGELLFGASSHHQWKEAIYSIPASGGVLTTWLDPSTATGPFHFPTWDGSWAVYTEGDPSNLYAIWATQGGIPRQLVAGSGGTTPSRDTFTWFDPPVIEEGEVVFAAEVNGGTLGSGWGVYHWNTNTQAVQTVADFRTEIPSGTGTFELFSDPSTDGTEIAFKGLEGYPGFGGQLGIYTGSLGGPFERIADLTTSPPGHSELFIGFGHSAVEDGVVIFHGITRQTDGIYGKVRGGPLFTIVENGDSFDGKTMSGGLIHAEGLHQGQLAMILSFPDFSSAVYTVRLFTLRAVGELHRGQSGQLRARGAQPGDAVRFIASLTGVGSGPCPPALGGMCLDLLNPLPIGAAIANAEGVAELQRMVPASLPPLPIHLQAVVANGANSIKSNTLSLPLF